MHRFLTVFVPIAVGLAVGWWTYTFLRDMRGPEGIGVAPAPELPVPAGGADRGVEGGEIEATGEDTGAGTAGVAGTTGAGAPPAEESGDAPAVRVSHEEATDEPEIFTRRPQQAVPTDPADGAYWYYELGNLLEEAPEELAASLEAASAGELDDLEANHDQLWQELIDAADKALARGEVHWPGLGGDVDYLAELPYLGWAKTAGDALAADAWRAHRQGRSLDAIDRFDDALEIANDIESGGVLVSNLFAGRLRRLAMENMMKLLSDADDPAMHERAIEILTRHEVARTPVATALSREAEATRNTLAKLVAGDDETRALLQDMQIELPEGVSLAEHFGPVIDEMEAYFHEIETQMSLPLSQSLPSIELLQQRMEERAASEPLLAALVLSAGALVHAEADALGRLRGVRVWCAVHIYRLREGELPERLQNVARYLSGLPHDPLTDAPPHYATGDQVSFRLWMVGKNLQNDACNRELDLVIEGL